MADHLALGRGQSFKTADAGLDFKDVDAGQKNLLGPDLRRPVPDRRGLIAFTRAQFEKHVGSEDEHRYCAASKSTERTATEMACINASKDRPPSSFCA